MPVGTPDRTEALNAWANKPDPVTAPAVTPPTPAPAPAAKAPDAPVAAPAAAGGTETPPAPADAPAASTAVGGPSDWMVFKKGEEEFRVPLDAQIEFKRRDQMLTRTADDFRRDGMMGTDYKLSKETIQAERQAFQREQERIAVEQARVAERQRYLEEQEAAFREAQTDPAKFEQWQTHLTQMAQNPMYRKAYEDALAKRQVDAENQVLRARAEEQYVTHAATTVQGWTEALAAKYPGVPVESVRRDYAAQVALYEQRAGRVGTLGEGPLTPQALEQVFQHHAGVFQQAVAPVNAELAGLKAQLAELKAAQDAAAANAQTAHAVKRQAAPPTAPVRGSAGVETAPRAKHESAMEREERMSRWVNQR